MALYAYHMPESTGEPTLVIHEVPDGTARDRWGGRNYQPPENEAAEAATVTTWVYHGGKVTQFRVHGYPRWRDLPAQ